jgi:hypothetical protein
LGVPGEAWNWSWGSLVSPSLARSAAILANRGGSRTDAPSRFLESSTRNAALASPWTRSGDSIDSTPSAITPIEKSSFHLPMSPRFLLKKVSSHTDDDWRLWTHNPGLSQSFIFHRRNLSDRIAPQRRSFPGSERGRTSWCLETRKTCGLVFPSIRWFD